MSVETPTLGHIGRYELLSRLGAGGMGEVFLARTSGAQGFEKRVVIKRILPHLAQDTEFVQRFVEEGKLVVQLSHAGIAQVLDMGEEGGVPYIAMEHIDGRDLAELLRLAAVGGVDTPLPVKLTIVARLLEALDYAHRATTVGGASMNIIHRDVSPANVMISRAGAVKLLDFGIARATERLHQSTSGAIRGKYSYMSPQQAAGRELDARSDQFSVGVVAWELLAGKRPFDGESDLLTLDRVRFFEPGSIAMFCPGLPAEIAAVVDRMLMKKPEDRFASCDAAMREIQRYLNSTDELLTARDVGGWVDAVLETLPKGLRDAGGAAMSLDDVLALGLPSEPRGDVATGTKRPTPAQPKTRTIHTDGDRDPSDAVAVDLGSAPAAAAMTTASGASVGRKRTWSFVLLVLMNVALLGAVGWLIWSDGDETEPKGASSDQVVADQATSAATAAPAADIAVAATAETKSEPSAPAKPEPTSAGTVAGSALGAALRVPAATDVPITFVSVPPGALVSVNGGPPSPTPLTLRASLASELEITFGLVGFASKTLRHKVMRATEVVAALEREQVVANATTTSNASAKRAPKSRRPAGTSRPRTKRSASGSRTPSGGSGRVTFRFFPANADVFVDGKAYPTAGSNIVKATLAAGEHRLRVVGADGKVLRKTFRVEAGETTNLSTLTLRAGP